MALWGCDDDFAQADGRVGLYDYLTRQVAAQDATEKGHTSLASYYTEKGETPGVWIGSGMVGIDSLDAGDVVTAEQMQALFGSGHHPLAHARRAGLPDDATPAAVQAVTRLGAPFKVYTPDVPPFQVEVARRIEDVNVEAGRARDEPVDIATRARVRTEVAREFFTAEYGRQPADAREFAATIAKNSRPKTTAVAGFDLAFSPVKSVSALWAIADTGTAAKIEIAHQAAIKDALDFIETHALFTREGTNGARQVNVTGLVGTAFTHRDSRAGDPDLHTHVAVANKVQTLQGKWLSIDGRLLFKAKVAASETYNTALEGHLVEALGVRFAVREDGDPRKRPVREIVGVDSALNTRWSTRRAIIQVRRAELATQFQTDHGRPPTPVESIQLAQQATLETRDAKHEPRSLAEQRHTWHREAVDVLGSEHAVQAMVTRALSPTGKPGPKVTAGWLDQTAARTLATLEEHRSTWQVTHVWAEALRQVRGATIGPDKTAQVVAWVVTDVLSERSIRLASDADPISDPDELRRADGVSVYQIAGSDLFTSARIIDAETRIIETAGQPGGRALDKEDVELAVLEAEAHGIDLNPGQAALVRQMATSGNRLQLAIAAAGTGKTTAMSVLTRAWEFSGGNVLGLAPSAAAAAVLGEQISSGQTGGHVDGRANARSGAHTDTLAKLVDSLTKNQPTDWMDTIGPDTLVLIDEAGMADTLPLDATISFLVGREATIRLIGDDQQLSAIGAGGILRDIDHTHGALRLNELMRFADPAEGTATLALRDGQPEALGFYLDHQRVHVGDQTTLTDKVFNGWLTDRGNSLDSIMLAPTRELVAELNARARSSRLDTQTGPDGAGRSGPVVRLADGNHASVGDLIITRVNDRRLRVSASDWVKNGDRWQVTDITDSGAIRARHMRSGLSVRLPAAYVATSTELGYASTVHTAQGVSADTMHGLATGAETRQQLYTMTTRGRTANHIYLVTVGDGDPHGLIRPENLHPETATDILEQILARDGSARSATTIGLEATSPSTQLGQAASRYHDALYFAAETFIGPKHVAALENNAEHLVPGIGDEPAWPVLRAHLILVQAQGRDAARDLAGAVDERALDGVRDRAAVLDWRLDPTGLRGARSGPLPWMPAIGDALAQDPKWGPYLAQRAARVEVLADQVRREATEGPVPVWARQALTPPPDDVIGEVAVWRAATGVSDEDRRPTGPAHLQKAATIWQHKLNNQVAGGRSPAMDEWAPLIHTVTPTRDAFTPVLAERLAAINRAGISARQLFTTAATQGPLPDEHASAALWWRISRHLSPAVAVTLDSADQNSDLTTSWSARFEQHAGTQTTERLMASPWWPTLVTAIDHALARGWRIEGLLPTTPVIGTDDVEPQVDPALALVWHIGVITNPPLAPEDTEPTEHNAPPEDLDQARTLAEWATHDSTVESVPEVALDRLTPVEALAREAFARDLLDPLGPIEADINAQLEWAYDTDHSPIPRARLLEVNHAAADFYEAQLRGSWTHTYLQERFGQCIAGDPRFRPGHAPKGWTTLVTHLRAKGFTDEEMVSAGVATIASTGRLIDRFRDRAVLPIIADSEVLGFVGRRHPEATDNDKAGPRYLNTPITILFHKNAQLFGIADPHMAVGAIPVVVEGPMDAIAVTLSTAGAFVGVAPLGTSLTSEQTTQLAHPGVDPIIATDGDIAGRVAAERDYWILTPHGLNPKTVRLEAGSDPASLLAENGPTSLRAAVRTPAERWAALGNSLDARLVGEHDWPATADMMQRVQDAGHDVHTLTRQLLADQPLVDPPAQDLRYRLAGHLPEDTFRDQSTVPARTTLSGTEQERRTPPSTTRQHDRGPRP